MRLNEQSTDSFCLVKGNSFTTDYRLVMDFYGPSLRTNVAVVGVDVDVDDDWLEGHSNFFFSESSKTEFDKKVSSRVIQSRSFSNFGSFSSKRRCRITTRIFFFEVVDGWPNFQLANWHSIIKQFWPWLTLLIKPVGANRFMIYYWHGHEILSTVSQILCVKPVSWRIKNSVNRHKTGIFY